MNCTNCGNPIGEGFKFCMKCGTPVGAPATSPAPAPGPAEPVTSPVYAPIAPAIIVDGMDYGEIKNHSSVRVILPAGTHTVCCGYLTGKQTNQYQINITPEYYNFAFKFNIVYRPYGRPGSGGFPTEFKQCAPEEIPYI